MIRSASNSDRTIFDFLLHTVVFRLVDRYIKRLRAFSFHNVRAHESKESDANERHLSTSKSVSIRIKDIFVLILTLDHRKHMLEKICLSMTIIEGRSAM